jgi:hypothetical protein
MTRFFRNFSLMGCALVLAACAGMAKAPSLSSQLDAAYATTAAFVQVTEQSLERGRITADQATKASANAKKVKDTLDAARVALAGCVPEKPCTAYTDLMSALQPSLLELERELRARQAQEQKR